MKPFSANEINVDMADAALCRRSLSFFVKYFWSLVVAEELVWSWHMEVLCDEMQAVLSRVFQQTDLATGRRYRLPKLYDLVINIPPGTSKSTICTIMAPAWAWCVDPTQRFISGSYSDLLATEHALKSRDVIESDKYKRLFPQVRLKSDKAGKTNYENTMLGQRYSCGVGGSVTGIHATAILIDDPLNPKQASSQAETETANTWMDTTLSMRKTDKAVTPTILIMQRLAVNDPTGYILAKEKDNVRHVCLPAEDGLNVLPVQLRKHYIGGLLDPVRLSWPVLLEAKKNLGGYGYAGQMQQEPTPAGGIIWQKWFKIVSDEMYPSISDATQVGTDWDTAYTEKDSNAASAYVTAGKIGVNCFIFDLDFAWLEMPELVKWMKTKKAPHYIEQKASGISLRQVLVRSGIVALEIPVKGGADKVARAKNATPPVEAGFWYVKQSLADKLYNDPKQGILRFPKGQYKDLADALAQCVQRLSGSALVTATGRQNESVQSSVRMTY